MLAACPGRAEGLRLDALHSPAVGAQGDQQIPGAAADVEQAAAERLSPRQPAHDLAVLAPPVRGLESFDEAASATAGIAFRVTAAGRLRRRPRPLVREAATQAAHDREALGVTRRQPVTRPYDDARSRASAQRARCAFEAVRHRRGIAGRHGPMLSPTAKLAAEPWRLVEDGTRSAGRGRKDGGA